MLKVKPFIVALLLMSYFGVSYAGPACASFDTSSIPNGSTLIEIVNNSGETIAQRKTGERFAYSSPWILVSGLPAIANKGAVCLKKPGNQNVSSGRIELKNLQGTTSTINFSTSYANTQLTTSCTGDGMASCSSSSGRYISTHYCNCILTSDKTKGN